MSGQEVLTSMLPVWVVIIPLLTTLLLIVFFASGLGATWCCPGRNGAYNGCRSQYVSSDHRQATDPGLRDTVFFISPLNLTFKVDALGFIVASSLHWSGWPPRFMPSAIWIMRRTREDFFVFLALTLVGTIGIPLAGDLLTLLVFF